MKAPEERLKEVKANPVCPEDTMDRLSDAVAEQRKKLDSISLRLKTLVENTEQALKTTYDIKPLHYPGKPNEDITCKILKNASSSWKPRWRIRKIPSSS